MCYNKDTEKEVIKMTVEELIDKLQHIHSNYIVTVCCGNMFDEANWDYLTELLHFENPMTFEENNEE